MISYLQNKIINPYYEIDQIILEQLCTLFETNLV